MSPDALRPSFAPAGFGADFFVSTTVATATGSPAASHRASASRISRIALPPPPDGHAEQEDDDEEHADRARVAQPALDHRRRDLADRQAGVRGRLGGRARRRRWWGSGG